MTSSTESIFQAALALPPVDRAALADKLLGSLSQNGGPEIAEAWAAEAETRVEAYELGKLKAISAEDVFRFDG
jgi:putative addiction module component (TIGR02574 family)